MSSGSWPAADDPSATSSTLSTLREHGIAFRSLTEGFDTTATGGEFLLHIMAAFTQMERRMIVERTHSDLEAIRRQCRHGDRPTVTWHPNAPNLPQNGQIGYAEQFGNWWFRYDVKPLFAEATVRNHTIGYAGTTDIGFESNKRGVSRSPTVSPLLSAEVDTAIVGGSPPEGEAQGGRALKSWPSGGFRASPQPRRHDRHRWRDREHGKSRTPRRRTESCRSCLEIVRRQLRWHDTYPSRCDGRSVRRLA